MRLAIYHNLPFSGAKRVVFEHVKGLKSLGHSIDLYTTDSLEGEDILSSSKIADNSYYYKYNPPEVKIPFIERALKDLSVFTSLRILHKRMATDIDSRNYDIVICHIDVLTQAPFLLRYLKTKNIYFCLEPNRIIYEYSLRPKNLGLFNKIYENTNRLLRKRIDLINALSADKTLAISLFGRERIIGAYDLYPKISYLGVDEKTFKPMNVKKKNQVMFVAEKRTIYGFDLAEKAISLIPKKQRPELKIVSWVRDNNQRFSDEELAKIYNESFVTLSLSRFDTFGLVPLESMACGVPVVALNVAGYRESVKDNETGLLTEFDPADIADKIMFFMNNPKAVEKMGKKGREWIEEKWTWKKQVLHLEKLLKEVQ